MSGIPYLLPCFSATLFKHLNDILTDICTAEEATSFFPLLC